MYVNLISVFGRVRESTQIQGNCCYSVATQCEEESRYA